MTNVPGASAVLDCGLVTYSNDAKKNLLGVREETLREHGAVSAAVAAADGGRSARQRHRGADFALAVTGIAGSGGGSGEQKPVRHGIHRAGHGRKNHRGGTLQSLRPRDLQICHFAAGAGFAEKGAGGLITKELFQLLARRVFARVDSLFGGEGAAGQFEIFAKVSRRFLQNRLGPTIAALMGVSARIT